LCSGAGFAVSRCPWFMWRSALWPWRTRPRLFAWRPLPASAPIRLIWRQLVPPAVYRSTRRQRWSIGLRLRAPPKGHRSKSTRFDLRFQRNNARRDPRIRSRGRHEWSWQAFRRLGRRWGTSSLEPTRTGGKFGADWPKTFLLATQAARRTEDAAGLLDRLRLIGNRDERRGSSRFAGAR